MDMTIDQSAYKIRRQRENRPDMSEPFSRQTWLLRQLGVGGGFKKRLQFYVAQGLVWLSAGALVPAIVAPPSASAACLALAAALISVGAGFKLSQVRRHSGLLTDLLTHIGVLPGSTELLTRVGKVSKIYVLFLLVILSAWMAYPWISGDLRLLLPYWTPFETETFIKFSIVYFFASISLLAVAYTQEAVDTIVLLIAAYICRRLAGVTESLLLIGEDSNEERITLKQKDEEILRKTILEHIEIIRLIREFDKLITDIFLIQVLQTTIVSTMCFYAASKVSTTTIYTKIFNGFFWFRLCYLVSVWAHQSPDEANSMPGEKLIEDLMDVPKFAMIITATYMQFYIYCWLGEEISQHGDAIHRGIYSSKWYQSSLSVKKSVNVLETFTKAHFKLNGGHIFTIHLETFLLMLKESFSFFMVLRAIVK